MSSAATAGSQSKGTIFLTGTATSEPEEPVVAVFKFSLPNAGTASIEARGWTGGGKQSGVGIGECNLHKLREAEQPIELAALSATRFQAFDYYEEYLEIPKFRAEVLEFGEGGLSKTGCPQVPRDDRPRNA